MTARYRNCPASFGEVETLPLKEKLEGIGNFLGCCGSDQPNFITQLIYSEDSLDLGIRCQSEQVATDIEQLGHGRPEKL